MYDFIDKTSTVQGTKINRKAMLAIQGFIGGTVSYSEFGGILTVIEANSEGQVLRTHFNLDNSVTEEFIGDSQSIQKHIVFSSDGTATEVLL